ncbi:MAG: sialate O-acetylesterase [Pedobacter sp.]|nr:MAG: sialate O-acetylesterase [Pedobacter sp.]
MKLRNILVCFLVMIISNAAGQEKTDPNFELYILIGQSNMAGRGVITPEEQLAGNPKVFMLDKDYHWTLAKHPLHFDKPKAAGVGPGLAFGIAMAEANPNVTIGLVPCAVGGTSIELWQPSAYDKATKTHPYDDALARIKEAMKSGTVKGILWHQGEGNSSVQKSKTYLIQLDTLVSRIRREVGNPNVPFIVGELGRYRPQYALINTELAKVPGLIPVSGLVSSEGLVHKGDSTHLDASSANSLGRRFAKKMIEMQNPQK